MASTTPVPAGHSDGAALPLPFTSLPTRLLPDRALLTYYALSSLLLGPGFFFMLVPMYFRYRTLRYEVDDEGVSVRWGILFRREVSLTYARIQDIHLSSNFVERWLGLGKIQIQTASGTASAEMVIEGIPEHEALRDFLYGRMRGARDGTAAEGLPSASSLTGDEMAELTQALQDTAAELRAVRSLLEELSAREEP